VKRPEHWRIIALTKLKRLDELPGLEKYALKVGSHKELLEEAKDGLYRMVDDHTQTLDRERVVNMRDVLQTLLGVRRLPRLELVNCQPLSHTYCTENGARSYDVASLLATSMVMHGVQSLAIFPLR
jgi:hypothetical protein